MYLSFEQKMAIFESFPELTRKVNKYGRVGYDFLGSNARKKEIARELTHTGNGYIYVGYLPEYRNQADPRGFLNIKELSASELKMLISKVIELFI